MIPIPVHIPVSSRKQFKGFTNAASKFVSVQGFFARQVLISCFQVSFARNLPGEKVLREIRFGETQGTNQIATVQGEQKTTQNRSNAGAVQGFPVAENQTRNYNKVVGQFSDD